MPKSHMPFTSPLRPGSRDPHVLMVQNQLLQLGFALPRFGADGVLGDETLAAYGKFLTASGLRAANDESPRTITNAGAAALNAAVNALGQVQPSIAVIDERGKHPHSGRSASKPYRRWNEITSIVLHQTATHFGEVPAKWHRVPIHFGVTRKGKAIQLYDLTEVCNHAHDFNPTSVGIEIDGWFAGIHGRPNTLWQPPNTPPRQPMLLTPAQLSAAQNVIRTIIDTVAANGGRIAHIYAHRQSSDQRTSDPGSNIWQEVGLWAQQQFGLSDGGAAFRIGTGKVIPVDWDTRYVGNKY